MSLGVGYNEDLSQIFPFVFQTGNDESIGIVAIGAVPDTDDIVYLYHIGAFEPRCGNGSRILKELCRQADKFNISLKASAMVMTDGKNPKMTTEQLIGWCEKFGFKESRGLMRRPEDLEEHS